MFDDEASSEPLAASERPCHTYIACRSELRFRTRVKWGDQYGGYGEQYFEYNHGPQHADTGHQPTYNNYV